MAAAPRTRAVQMPGEIIPITEEEAQAGGLPAEVAAERREEAAQAEPSAADLLKALQAQQRQIEQLQAQLKAKADAPASMPAALPSVDQVLEKAPAVPVLTRDGWFVPESGPLNPKRDRL